MDNIRNFVNDGWQFFSRNVTVILLHILNNQRKQTHTFRPDWLMIFKSWTNAIYSYNHFQLIGESITRICLNTHLKTENHRKNKLKYHWKENWTLSEMEMSLKLKYTHSDSDSSSFVSALNFWSHLPKGSRLDRP